jgi:hypothetical protein
MRSVVTDEVIRMIGINPDKPGRLAWMTDKTSRHLVAHARILITQRKTIRADFPWAEADSPNSPILCITKTPNIHGLPGVRGKCANHLRVGKWIGNTGRKHADGQLQSFMTSNI